MVLLVNKLKIKLWETRQKSGHYCNTKTTVQILQYMIELTKKLTIAIYTTNPILARRFWYHGPLIAWVDKNIKIIIIKKVTLSENFSFHTVTWY